MKITSIPLLLVVSMVGTVSAQNQNDNCLDLETSCLTTEGTSCRFIPQLKADKCGLQTVTVEATWCNNTGKHQRITTESTLKLSGGAISSINNGNQKVLPVPSGVLSRGECDEESWTFQINNCKQSFNYEVNVKTADSQCRGFFFTRQMKTLCKSGGEVTCTLPNGTRCEDYDGPSLKTISEPGCDPIACIDQSPESCKQDLNYGFTARNRVGQPLDFDLSSPQVANSKVAWKIVQPNDVNFGNLPGNSDRTWYFKKEDVNICRVIPSASLNVRGNIIDTQNNNKKDPDYQFCFNFVNQKVRKFDNGVKLPFCSDIGPVGELPNTSNSNSASASASTASARSGKGKGKGESKSKGKGKGGPTTPPTTTPPVPCPAVIPGSPSEVKPRGNDEL